MPYEETEDIYLIIFLDRFGHISKSRESRNFSKCTFQQRIRIAQENVKTIREKECSSGKHFKSTSKNVILNERLLSDTNSREPAAPS